MSQPQNPPIRPLEGIRVLSVENFLSGPYAGMLLADFGAEVIKVESEHGDYFRSYKPYEQNEHGLMGWRFLRINRNKRSVVIDLHTPRGRDLFLELVDHADVVLENLRPGAMDRLGLGWEALHARNPRLIYVSLSGFGHADVLPGPFGNLPAFDIILQAMSGIVWCPGKEGDPPVFLGFSIADQTAGIMGAFGATLALQWRNLTGQGMHVDLSMYDCMVMFNEIEVGYYGFFGEQQERGVGTIAPFNLFKGSDGWFAVGVSGEVIWRRFCTAIERPDLAERPDLQSGYERAKAHESVLRPIIEEWASHLPVTEVCNRLNAAGVPSGPVQTVADLFKCPQVAARNMLLDLHDPVAGKMTVAGNPIKFSAVPEVEARTAPQLGADTDAVLREWLGFSPEQLAALRAEKIIDGPKVPTPV